MYHSFLDDEFMEGRVPRYTHTQLPDARSQVDTVMHRLYEVRDRGSMRCKLINSQRGYNKEIWYCKAHLTR